MYENQRTTITSYPRQLTFLTNGPIKYWSLHFCCRRWIPAMAMCVLQQRFVFDFIFTSDPTGVFFFRCNGFGFHEPTRRVLSTCLEIEKKTLRPANRLCTRNQGALHTCPVAITIQFTLRYVYTCTLYMIPTLITLARTMYTVHVLRVLFANRTHL